jgi:hypothetical protein
VKNTCITGWGLSLFGWPAAVKSRLSSDKDPPLHQQSSIDDPAGWANADTCQYWHGIEMRLATCRVEHVRLIAGARVTVFLVAPPSLRFDNHEKDQAFSR